MIGGCRSALLCLAVTLTASEGSAQEFSYLPPGDLVAGSGQGRADDVIYAPTMLFPMQQSPAFANSQVWGNGGFQGPGGGQCDDVNYSYPWRDNYCETRSWDMPLCPSGAGHQGQDIRAATCDKDQYWVVAAENGTITNVGSYSVYLTANDGTRFDYLHMSNVQVSVGQDVLRGDQLGQVSNEFGGTATTIHLHFNIRQNIAGIGTIYVPPYTSLINAYPLSTSGSIDGALEAVGCDALVGWAFDPNDAESPVDVPFVFDSSGVAHDVRADVYRGDLCENLSFCDHGFDIPPPYSLFDGMPHSVDATSGSVTGGSGSLPGSPLSMSCEPPPLVGERRAVSTDAFAAWSLSAFWDEPPVEADDVEDVSVGEAFPGAPEIWLIDDAFYVVDSPLARLRPITAAAMRAWRFDEEDASAHDEDEMTIGDDWPSRPLLVRDSRGDVFAMDVPGPSTSSGGNGAGGTTTVVPPGPDPDNGCSCTTTRPRERASWSWLILLAAAAYRRTAYRRTAYRRTHRGHRAP